MTTISIPLSTGWSFTQLSGNERNQEGNKGTDVGEWLPTTVPTGVHEELLKVSRIPDPFVGTLWCPPMSPTSPPHLHTRP